MLFIPGFVISILTFPGVICHEYAHKVACGWRGIRVHEVVYFQLGNPAGYVRHEQPRRQSDAFWISTAPFAVNSVLAVVVFLLGLTIDAAIPIEDNYANLLFVWVAFSCGMHAFPSKGDAQSLWQLTKQNWRSSVGAFLTIPVVVIIYVGHYLSYFWLDAIYSLGLLLLAVTVFDAGASILPLFIPA